MNHKNWQRTEELFHEAVGLNAEERAVYLAEACQQDAPLRAEVESLIAAFENRNEFMAQPVFSLGMKLMSAESKDETLVGRMIGPYKILAMLGKGGMGEVYLAEDSRLDRKVALKFLSNRFTDDAWAKRQLEKEAQAIARLNHPNICTVHYIEEFDSYKFIVMEHVEGKTLSLMISEKLLEPIEIPRLAIQIVSALAKAHDHGIIHRDIKPSNIMVTASGQVKVLDFGIAKLVQQRLGALVAGDSENQSSQSGLVPGTVAYMSPEQSRGEKLDFRSDIFSFGIVLYEMTAGRNPYSQQSNAEIISELTQITEKCLKRDREERYQSASELLIDLSAPSKDVATQTYWRRQLSFRTLVGLALLLLVIIGISYALLHKAKARTLAVLPITSSGADLNNEVLSYGLTEGLSGRLSRLPELKVKAPTIVPVYESEADVRRRAGRDFDVDYVLLGTLAPQNDLLILNLTLVNAKEEKIIWEGEFGLKPADLLRLQDELAYQVASRLQPSLSKYEKRLLAARQTDNPEAYRLYTLGRFLCRKRSADNIQEAIKLFNQAIELDPYYAQPRAGLADCYVLQNSVAYGSMTTEEAMSKAMGAAKDALQIDDKLSEAHTSLGVIKLRYEWNWQEAERAFVRAISLDPDYPLAHFWYSQLLALIGRPDEAIRESEIAKQLDPFSPIAEMNFGRALYMGRQYDRAIAYFLKMLERDSADKNALYMLGLLYQQKGLLKQSVESLEKLYSLKPDLAAAPLGYAYAKVSRRADALKMIDELEEIKKHKPISDQEKAIIYMGLGDNDKAFLFFQKACDERSGSLPFIKIDPLFDSIRSDPRYTDLAQCANIAQS